MYIYLKGPKAEPVAVNALFETLDWTFILEAGSFFGLPNIHNTHCSIPFVVSAVVFATSLCAHWTRTSVYAVSACVARG